MFRLSLVLGVLLLLGVAAKPWDKHTRKTFQETSMLKHDKGELFQRVEVEPPEDMDKTDYDVDPRMRIWKNMRDGKQDKQPERSRDELHVPSLSEINIVKIQRVDPHSDISIKSLQESAKSKTVRGEDGIDRPLLKKVVVKIPEPDMDKVYHKMRKGEKAAGHLGPVVAKNNQDAAHRQPEIHVDQTRKTVHLEPEEDMDGIYHRNIFNPALQQVDTKAAAASVQVPTQRRHSEPEKDMDTIYHRKTFNPALQQVDTKAAAASVHMPTQRRHSEPEKDMDTIYHRKTFIPTSHQEDTEPAAAFVPMPPQKRYTQPEEDLDAVYHR